MSSVMNIRRNMINKKIVCNEKVFAIQTFSLENWCMALRIAHIVSTLIHKKENWISRDKLTTGSYKTRKTV